MEIRLLGPVELVVDDEVRPLPAKPRALLTLLALHANEVVSTDRIVEELWEGDPPETAVKAAQIYVSQLRKHVGDRLESRAPGYRLRVEPGEVDREWFEELLARADSAPADQAVSLLDEALGLWRGAAIAEFRDTGFARDEVTRLDERRLEAQEARLAALLDLGRHTSAVADLERLVREHPLRERPHELLMLALYRSGRQADALEVARSLRTRLDEELGLAPGVAVRELETAILRQEPALDMPARRRAEPAWDPVGRSPTPWPRISTALGIVVPLALLIGGFVITHHDGGSDDAPRKAFVAKLENFLAQSSQGRTQVVALVRDAQSCRLAPAKALGRLELVERNRQSVLDQLAALSVPDERDTARASDLLQKAIQASIAADFAYRGWLAGARGCPHDAPPTSQANRRAQAAKDAFVHVFNPLAARYGATQWDPHRF